MATLEKRIAELESALDDAGLYARDRAAFDRATADLTAARAAYAEAQEEWLELELLREELEAKHRASD
jgi:ATP-binding cassette subfamily F protein uup